MEMPKPGDEHRKLNALVGRWKGEDRILPMPWDPKGGVATSRVTVELDLDGFWVIMDYAQERDGRVSYRGHGVFGWDSFAGKYTMHWFDSMGIDPGAPALGTWQGNTLTYLQHHHMGHGRMTYTFESADRYTFSLEKSQDGTNWMPFIKATYARVK
jgi:hypothetical protein